MQPFLEGGAVGAVLDGDNDPLDLLLDVGQFLAVRLSGGAALAVETVGFVRPGAHRFIGRLGRHQMVLETDQDPLREFVAANAAPVGTAAVHDVVGAAVAILPAHGIRAATGAALQQSREEVPGAVGAVQAIGARTARGLDDGRVFCGQFFLPVFHRPPEFIVHDAELGNLGDNPLLTRIDPRNPLAGLRVLDVAQPVPDQAPDIELVVDQPGATLDLATDGGVRPELGRRGCQAPTKRS